VGREEGEGEDYGNGDDRQTFDEPRDVLPDKGDTLTVRVSTDGTDLTLEFLGSRDDIFREHISCPLSECRPFHQRRNLHNVPHQRPKNAPYPAKR